MIEGSYTWREVLEEVKKTDKYDGKIECYVLFTTANRHTSIQNQQNSDAPHFHKRPDGSSFPVLVKYWQDYEAGDLRLVPERVLRHAFSNAIEFANSIAPPSIDEYTASLAALRSYIPPRISLKNLEWLEWHDFSSGRLQEQAYEPFHSLYLQLVRLEDALRLQMKDVLQSAGYPEMQATLPAGNEFYSALKEFVCSVRPHIIGETEKDGTSTLSLVGISGWQGKAHQIGSGARYLAQIYRKSVLGQWV